MERDPHQTRIAVLEDDRLAEIFLESHRHRGLVGSVFLGRVIRVLPGMQAAFVDLGLSRDAFLYVSDAAVGEDDTAVESGEALETGDLRVDAEPSIEDLLRVGQEILVQVRKDSIANKGARVSAQITLPSRYAVLVPRSKQLGISRRIEDEAERERLLALLEELKPEDAGLIARTEAEGRGREELAQDITLLLSSWEEISARAESNAAPCLVHGDVSLISRAVRDLFNQDYSALWADSEEAYEEIAELLARTQPELLGTVRLDDHELGLFERFGVDKEIEAALESKVWLRSGGYLVINPTEALVAIDVNTGRFVGKDSLEDTIFRTNLEAVREIVRQIRLRDLGGILVLDLIDMEEEAHRVEVFEFLEEELKKDRSRTRVLNISEFGLVELTRKRSRSNLRSLLTRACPHCKGSGTIRSVRTVCLDLRREVLKRPRLAPDTELLLRVHPEVADALHGGERAILEELEGLLEGRVLVRGDPELHHEHFDVFEL